MNPIRETAFAKINLALHVRGKRADGFHDIETIFCFADSGDILTGKQSDHLALDISGVFADRLSATDNLVLEAAEILRKYCKLSEGAELKLEKRLPVASGIGGGSADAAAALRLLNRLWGCGLTLEQLASLATQLGADVPACVYSRTIQGTGTGTQLEIIEDEKLKGMPLLLINPLQGVSTADVFGEWSGFDDGALPRGNILDVAKASLNGLQAPATKLCGSIQQIIEKLNTISAPILVRMSGSGATCFGLYQSESDRDAAYQALLADCPDWWLMGGTIR